jgi:hypothetical protein
MIVDLNRSKPGDQIAGCPTLASGVFDDWIITTALPLAGLTKDSPNP